MNIVLLARKRRKVRHWFFPSLVRASLKHILYQYTYFIHKYLTVLSILRLTQDPSIKVWRVDSDVWAAAGRQIPEMSAGSLFLLSLLYTYTYPSLFTIYCSPTPAHVQQQQRISKIIRLWGESGTTERRFGCANALKCSRRPRELTHDYLLALCITLQL